MRIFEVMSSILSDWLIDWLIDHFDGVKYVPELRPPRSLLFIPLLIYEPGEQWWNDIYRGKLLIHLLELSGNRTNSVI
jgi:hypothetical protein